MLEQLACVIDGEPEIQNGDAGEGMCEPTRLALARVVPQHLLANAKAFGEITS